MTRASVLAFLFAHLVWAPSLFAEPSIKKVSGAFVSGQPITIFGSNFGANRAEAEFTGFAIEAQAPGSTFSRSRWEARSSLATSAPVLIAADHSHSGSHSLKVLVSSHNGILRYAFKSAVGTQDKLFLSWWVRMRTTLRGQWKMLRLSRDATVVDGPQEMAFFAWQGTGAPQVVVDPNSANDQTKWPNPTIYPSANDTWYRQDVEVETSSDRDSRDGTVRITLFTPNFPIKTETFTRLKTNLHGSYNHAMWQNYIGNGMGPSSFWLDDIYVQHGSVARVELCDKPRWRARQSCEIQPFSSWGSSITALFNPGSFAKGTKAYLYVVDDKGNANEKGYPVTEGDIRP